MRYKWNKGGKRLLKREDEPRYSWLQRAVRAIVIVVLFLLILTVIFAIRLGAWQ